MYKKGSLFIFLLLSVLTHAQTGGYSIEVKLKNSPRKQLLLGYYLGDKTYVKDTVDVVNHTAVFKGNEPLAYGIYLVAEPEKMKFAEILIDDSDQHFFLEVDYTAGQPLLNVQGSAINQQFKTHIDYLAARRKEKETLEKQIEKETSAAGKKKAEEALNKLDAAVVQYQQQYVSEHPRSLLAAIIKASQPLQPPVFTGSKEEKDLQNWQWHKTHWFDHIDMADDRMGRTRILAERINYFTDKLTTQHPDSIILSVDEVLKRVKPAKENFRFVLQYLLNKYARSTIIGMDAVYVHIALEYYDKLKPDWIEKEQLDKITDKATKLKPLLIGKKAPDLQLGSVSGTRISLHEFEAKYSILFFYNTNSPLSTKGLPVLKTVADKYAAKGVKVITVCANHGNPADSLEVDDAGLADFVKKNDMGSFFNTRDATGQKNAVTLYDVSSVPLLYLLDEQKIIVSKRLGAEQLDKVLGSLGL